MLFSFELCLVEPRFAVLVHAVLEFLLFSFELCTICKEDVGCQELGKALLFSFELCSKLLALRHRDTTVSFLACYFLLNYAVQVSNSGRHYCDLEVTCYFLLNYALILSIVPVTVAATAVLLFSFELCML